MLINIYGFCFIFSIKFSTSLKVEYIFVIRFEVTPNLPKKAPSSLRCLKECQEFKIDFSFFSLIPLKFKSSFGFSSKIFIKPSSPYFSKISVADFFVKPLIILVRKKKSSCSFTCRVLNSN